MPYITPKERNFIQVDKGLWDLVAWLETVTIEKRKGYIAYIVNYVAKHSFNQNYFGKSTGTDAIRSAFVEMKRDLIIYEIKKKEENGEV